MTDLKGGRRWHDVPTPQPLTRREFLEMVDRHRAMPQCRTCMMPQRCVIGRLLDTIAEADEFTRSKA